MNDRLTAEIERIRSNSSILGLDEANVKQGVILRILNALGWDTFDIDEVKPEHPVPGGNVDYCLCLDGTDRVFVEVKRPRENLHVHQEQLLKYAFAQGVPIAVLTNGLDWWFYRPSGGGTWEERRFSVIELRNPDVSQTTDYLINFLSRENFRTGAALVNADIFLDGLWRDKKIKEALPKAWNQLITEPNDQLLALLNQKVTELCGFGASQDQIKRFLANLPKPAPALPNPPPPPDPRPPRPPRNVRYINKQIVRFTFNSQTYNVNKWYELLITLAEQIYLKHPGDFHRVVELRGSKRRYFSQNQQDMRVPKPIGRSGYYAETKLNADLFATVSHNLIVQFGYSPDDLQIETAWPRQDPTQWLRPDPQP